MIVQEYVPRYRDAFFSRLKESAAQRGIEVLVAAGTPGATLATRGDDSSSAIDIKIWQKELKFLGRRITLRNIMPALRDADAVVMEQARRNLDAYLLFGRKNCRLRKGLWGHGKDYTNPTSRADKRLVKWLVNRSNWFFAYTPGGAEAVASYGFPADRVTTVFNSIDSTALRSQVGSVTSIDIERFRRAETLRGTVLLFLGALDSSKRLDFLIESVDLLRKQRPNFTLLVAGEGRMRTYIEKCASTRPYVRVTGALQGRQKATALASCAAIVMPGRVGLVAVDSFAAGKPIVTTDWPWHAPEFEYLRAGEVAVVTDNNVHSFAHELDSLLNDPSRMRRLQAGAHERHGHYSVEAMAENYARGLSDWLLAEGRGGKS